MVSVSTAFPKIHQSSTKQCLVSWSPGREGGREACCVPRLEKTDRSAGLSWVFPWWLERPATEMVSRAVPRGGTTSQKERTHRS